MPRPPRGRNFASLARTTAVVVGLLGATAILLGSFQRHYPIQDWLFWRYATYWIVSIYLCFACAAGGHTLLRWLVKRPLPWLEQLAVGQALGMMAFQLALFGLGLVRLYHPITFFALPLAFFALGGRSFFRSLRRGAVHFCAPSRARRLSLVTWVAILFGFTALLALYLPVMSPINSSFDARWRHLYIAEQYVHFGGIRRFDEGWSLGASPQFTPLLYTWGFMFRGGLLFDRVELCAHIEFVLFLWTTLIGVPALVRRMIPRANPATVWAARFLFPGTFLYDSNLSVGADHIGALFAPPLMLAAIRYWRAPDIRRGLLLGTLIAAAVCAKETTALLLAPFPIALVAARFVVDLARNVRKPRAGMPLLGGLVAGLATVVLTMPHWLKNLLWYGDPLYPNLHTLFHGRPWTPHASYSFEYGFKTMLWAPTRDLDGLREALQAMVTFAFRPHGWWSMHRDVPVLGSLFTLLLIVLPFFRGTRRIWLVAACVHFSVFAWFWVHHEDRHLQALVPWMAAMVAATSTLIWRERRKLTRACLAVLIGAQAVWGADVYFIPTHSMVGGPGLKAPMELLAQGYLTNFDRRFDFQQDQIQISKLVPEWAVLLVHERRDHLGFNRRTVTDVAGDQYGIDWLDLATPDRIYAKLRSMYVTHAVWLDGHSEGVEPLGGDIAFFEFVQRFTTNKQRVNAYDFAALQKVAPPRPAPESRLVAVMGCDGIDYPSGLYQLTDLATPRFGPAKVIFPSPREALSDPDQWRKRVMAIAIDTLCAQPQLPKHLDREFERMARRGDRWGRAHDIWLRRP